MGVLAVWFTLAIHWTRENTGNGFSRCAATARLSRSSCVVADVGRLGRVDENHSAREPLKTGLLGRLGRLFQTHSRPEPTHGEKGDRGAEKLHDCEGGVLRVPRALAVKPHRPLSEHEWAILVRAGAEHDPIIIEALRLFDARVVEMTARRRRFVGSISTFGDRTTESTSARCAQ